jgi:hypothetical protein
MCYDPKNKIIPIDRYEDIKKMHENGVYTREDLPKIDNIDYREYYNCILDWMKFRPGYDICSFIQIFFRYENNIFSNLSDVEEIRKYDVYLARLVIFLLKRALKLNLIDRETLSEVIEESNLILQEKNYGPNMNDIFDSNLYGLFMSLFSQNKFSVCISDLKYDYLDGIEDITV